MKLRFPIILITSIIFVWVGVLFSSSFLDQGARGLIYNLSGIFVAVLALIAAFVIEKRKKKEDKK